MKIEVLADADAVAQPAAALIAAEAWAAVRARGRFALTLTYPILHRARRILWLVTGRGQREARGIPAATIQALRDGSLPVDAKAAALVAFTRAHVLDVIVITALKTISNYTNHLAHTPLDAAIASQKWTRPIQNPTANKS